jgi:hypothetical protein
MSASDGITASGRRLPSPTNWATPGRAFLAQRFQSFSNTVPTMFFIEAPSTINEILVGNYILSQDADVRRHRWLIMELLKTYHHNFVRHLIEGELQRRLYALAEQGQPITASLLNKVQGEILEEFWGGEVENRRRRQAGLDAPSPLLPRIVPVHLLGRTYHWHCGSQSYPGARCPGS